MGKTTLRVEGAIAFAVNFAERSIRYSRPSAKHGLVRKTKCKAILLLQPLARHFVTAPDGYFCAPPREHQQLSRVRAESSRSNTRARFRLSARKTRMTRTERRREIRDGERDRKTGRRTDGRKNRRTYSIDDYARTERGKTEERKRENGDARWITYV